ncbi:hypothetical protein FB451DRAFT_1397838 [Mycena latifolia]|nr:hypothetical protein FB451DRAFT_1397838 [Mycena latifolia]
MDQSSAEEEEHGTHRTVLDDTQRAFGFLPDVMRLSHSGRRLLPILRKYRVQERRDAPRRLNTRALDLDHSEAVLIRAGLTFGVAEGRYNGSVETREHAASVIGSITACRFLLLGQILQHVCLQLKRFTLCEKAGRRKNICLQLDRTQVAAAPRTSAPRRPRPLLRPPRASTTPPRHDSVPRPATAGGLSVLNAARAVRGWMRMYSVPPGYHAHYAYGPPPAVDERGYDGRYAKGYPVLGARPHAHDTHDGSGICGIGMGEGSGGGGAGGVPVVHTDDAATKLSDRVRRRCFDCTAETKEGHARAPAQFPHKRSPLAWSARCALRGAQYPSRASPPSVRISSVRVGFGQRAEQVWARGAKDAVSSAAPPPQGEPHMRPEARASAQMASCRTARSETAAERQRERECECEPPGTPLPQHNGGSASPRELGEDRREEQGREMEMGRSRRRAPVIHRSRTPTPLSVPPAPQSLPSQVSSSRS